MKKIFTNVLFAATSPVLSAQTFTLKSNDVGGQAAQSQFANVFGFNFMNFTNLVST